MYFQLSFSISKYGYAQYNTLGVYNVFNTDPESLSLTASHICRWSAKLPAEAELSVACSVKL